LIFYTEDYAAAAFLIPELTDESRFLFNAVELPEWAMLRERVIAPLPLLILGR